MRFVGQKDGEDQDPNNVQVDAGRGKGQGKSAPDPIRIGAIQATTCSRCGARGHSARECWAGGGKQYDLVEDLNCPTAYRSSQDHEKQIEATAGCSELMGGCPRAFWQGSTLLCRDVFWRGSHGRP
ncbi:ZCCHC17 [Symbiodinium natans]|uniref:ZCCHC17 protein n=1 Tax=Symbiodinium natans TaxID=878477 RepID=A0A812JG37_9DINO|nr:ZCCHC17 [Symbiodinium natans]